MSQQSAKGFRGLGLGVQGFYKSIKGSIRV